MFQIENTTTIAINSFLEAFDLVQLINSPTRTTATSATLTDLILTSDESVVSNKGVIDMSHASDHDLICVKLWVRIKFMPKLITYRD